MKNVQSLTGKRFGKLTVADIYHKRNGKIYWEVFCDCGNKTEARADKLRSGRKKSCGCIYGENKKKQASKKKRSKVINRRFYNIWKGMKRRCLSKGSKDYINYGLKGISVCDSWKEYTNFEKDMYLEYVRHSILNGEENTTIERINVKGNYEPSNCRWATQQEQQENRCNNIVITYKGKKYKTLSELARKYEVDVRVLFNRYYTGWSLDDAINTPVKKKRPF